MNLARRFQRELTTGRITLPVSVLLSLLLWSRSLDSADTYINLMVFALIGYLSIEINTVFSLIRNRTTLHACMFWLISGICVFLHPFRLVHLIPLAFMLAFFQLFGSYEREECKSNAFNTFFCLSACSLLSPHFIYFCIPFLIGMIAFRSISFQTFLTGLLGIVLPYWFLFGYAFLTDNMSLFFSPFHSMITMAPISYGTISLSQWIAIGFISVCGLVSSAHYMTVSHQDKTKVRILLSFLIFIEVCIVVAFLLQPQHLIPLFITQTFITSIMTSHLLVLTRTRFSFIMLISILVFLMCWAIYSLIME